MKHFATQHNSVFRLVLWWCVIVFYSLTSNVTPRMQRVVHLFSQVARRCCSQRAELQSCEDVGLSPLNLIIVICAQYFGQAASDEVNESNLL